MNKNVPSPQAAPGTPSAPSAPKRSLTPRRRAREYALQGVYQSLVMRRAGSPPNAAAIAKQLAEVSIEFFVVPLADFELSNFSWA